MINPDFTMEECSQLRKLIEEFPNLFADDPKRPSRIKIEDAHCLELERNSPVRTRPKRLPPSWEEEVTQQVEEMCRNGICRPSKSPWASDVVLVRKKDGQLRFAIDYRQLNAITKRDAYGPPNPQSILDKLSGSKWFSCLDIASAYWCVPMRKSDIEKNGIPHTKGAI